MGLVDWALCFDQSTMDDVFYERKRLENEKKKAASKENALNLVSDALDLGADLVVVLVTLSQVKEGGWLVEKESGLDQGGADNHAGKDDLPGKVGGARLLPLLATGCLRVVGRRAGRNSGISGHAAAKAQRARTRTQCL